MANRVIAGKIANGVYGLKVAKEGVDVTTAKATDLLFDSSIKRYGVIYAGGKVSGTSTASINFKSSKTNIFRIVSLIF